jgi:voltage-gated potassium channel
MMDDRAQRLEQRFEIPMLIAAVLVIPAIVLDEAHVGAFLATLGKTLNWLIWCAFAAEVVTMLVVTKDRWAWMRRHPLDLVIVVLTPPFAPASLQAARAVRLLRVLRVLRLAPAARRLFSLEGLRYAALLTFVTVMGGGAGFAALENGHHDAHVSAWDGVWWAITTTTTVGYGDLAPVTTGGRIIAIAVMIVGVGFVALLAGGAAQRFLARDVAEIEAGEIRLDEVVADLDRTEFDMLAEVREIAARLARLETELARRRP